MKLKRIACCILMCLSGLPCARAQGDLQGPSGGLFLDPVTGKLRLISGGAGAWVVSAAGDLTGYTPDLISPGRSYLVGHAADDCTPAVLKFTWLRLAGAQCADRFAVANSGAVLALYATARRHLQVWTGLPDSPALAWESALERGAVIAAMAVAGDARTVLLAYAEPRSGGILRVTADGAASIGPAGSVASVSFLDDRSAAAAYSSDNNVLLFTDVNGSATWSTFLEASSILDHPTAVLALGGDRGIAVSNRTNVAVLNPQTRAVTALPTLCAPAALLTLPAGRAAVVCATGDLSVLETNGRDPRLLFVPPLPNGERKQ